jgi:O-antigen/teichoic acid export membrane protein
LALHEKSLDGALWIFIDLLVNKASFFIATIVLANLLGPEEFGLLGLITIFFTIGNTLLDSGLSTSLLRLKNLEDDDYSTVYILNVFLALLIYFIFFLLSPFIAGFYNQEILENLIKVYCLGFIFNSFRVVQNTILIKNLNFRKITLYNAPGNILSFILSIWMANNGYKVWSIVALFLINQVIATIVFTLLSDWKPKLRFSKSKAKYHFNFGYKLMLSTQLNIIFDNVYNTIIGKFYDIKTLGFYERAYTLNSYPNQIITSIFSKLSLPILANLSDNKIQMAIVYRKIVLMAFFISAPLMIGIMVLAKPIFIMILGKEWLEAVPFFKILCLAFMFYPIHSLNINLLSIFGKSNLFLRLEIIKKVLISIVVTISFYYGITILIWSNVFVSVAALFINAYYNDKLISYSAFKQAKDMLPILCISSIMGILMHFCLKYIFVGNNELFQLVFISIIGIAAYISIFIFLRNETLKNILSILKIKSIL